MRSFTTVLSPSMSTSETLSIAATSGSTSRGTAMSTMKSGRCGRLAIAARTCSSFTTKFEAPVDATTTSAAAIASTSSGISTASPTPVSATRSRDRAIVRFATMTRPAPSWRKRFTAVRPILPAPTTSTDAPSSAPSRERAASTAAVAIETDSPPIPVCARAAFPAASASRKSRCNVRPSDFARVAAT